MRKKENVDFSGETLKRILVEKNISIAKLARQINIARESLHRCIKSNSVSVENLEKISKILNVSTFTLKYGYIEGGFNTGKENLGKWSFALDRKDEVLIESRKDIYNHFAKIMNDIEYLSTFDDETFSKYFEMVLSKADVKIVTECINLADISSEFKKRIYGAFIKSMLNDSKRLHASVNEKWIEYANIQVMNFGRSDERLEPDEEEKENDLEQKAEAAQLEKLGDFYKSDPKEVSDNGNS